MKGYKKDEFEREEYVFRMSIRRLSRLGKGSKNNYLLVVFYY